MRGYHPALKAGAGSAPCLQECTKPFKDLDAQKHLLPHTSLTIAVKH